MTRKQSSRAITRRSFGKLAAAGAAAFVLPRVAFAQQKPIKLGFLASYTGSAPTVAREVPTALKIFQAKYGDTIAGRKYEIILRDDHGPSPTTTRRLVQELINVDQVDFVCGTDFTPDAIAAAEVTTQAKKPLFILNAATTGIIAKAPYASRYSAVSSQSAHPVSEWALKNGIKELFALYTGYGPGIDAMNYLRKIYTDGGGTFVGEVQTPVNSSDFTAYVQRIKDSGVKNVFVSLPATNEPRLFLKAFGDAGLHQAGVKIICGGALVDDSYIDAIGDVALDVVSFWGSSDVLDLDANREFVKAFAGASPDKIRPDTFAFLTYDVMLAVQKVIETNQGDTDADKTMAVVRGLKLDTPRGPIEIDPVTRECTQNLYFRKVERQGDRLVNTTIDTIPMVKA